MSFILDALKKSESERQRQSAPALFEVKVAPPRSRFPLWAALIGGLLVINLGVVAWVLLRPPEATEPASAAVAVALPPAAPVTSTPPAGSATAPPAEATPPPAAASPAEPAADAEADPMLAEREPATEALNPDDYEPAVDAPAPEPAYAGVTRGTASGLPDYEDAAAAETGMPELKLDLHVYSPRRQDRFVLINMRRLREGETLPEGVRVDRITPDGAVLTFRGTTFLMQRQ